MFNIDVKLISLQCESYEDFTMQKLMQCVCISLDSVLKILFLDIHMSFG